ncbi:hypothetical protein ALC57_06368 [Trachymyrmex cornetzi]|uniref:Uncharacterized protein n=1 Tax=Trachymyrmex cornetzi TaxID=471704 RepID=A0A151J8X1_9HYME|nr:hypothetical protein ALC57_06368 [Trachymyrmex cornetzi]
MLKLYEKLNPRNNPHDNEGGKERMAMEQLPQFNTAILATIGVNGGRR